MVDHGRNNCKTNIKKWGILKMTDYQAMTKEELTRRIDYDKQLLLLPTMYDKMNKMVAEDRIACENELKNRKNLKFHLIEGEYLTESDYEEFKNYYLNHLEYNKKDIKELCGLSYTRLKEYTRRVTRETGLRRYKIGRDNTIILKKIKED